VDATRTQRKRTTEKHLENRSGKGNVDSGLQVQLEVDKCYSGCHKATEEEGDRETLGKEIWRGKCGQWASGSAGGRWRR